MALIGLGARKGIAPPDLLAEVGLQAEQLSQPDNAVPYSSALDLWAALIQRFPTDPLALELAEGWSTNSLGLLGFLAANVERLGEALDAFTRFQHLIDGQERMAWERRGERLVITLADDAELRALRHPMEALLASGHAFLNGLTENPFEALEIRFAHDRVLEMERYAGFFGTRHITFDAECYEAHYPWRITELRIAGAEPALGRLLEQRAESELERWDGNGDVVEQLSRWIRERLERGVSLSEAAGALAMSERSIQRELAERGTSFSALVDTERERLASLLLEDPAGPTIAEIAWRLGYSEPASFTRAFRRWTGVSPSDWRAERS